METSNFDGKAASGTDATGIAAGEGQFPQLFEAMRDGVVLLGMDGSFRQWNSAFIEMVQYAPDELKTLACVDVTPPKWHEAEARVFRQQLLLDGQTALYEKEYIRKDGSILPVELKAHLVRDASGEAEAVLAVVRDISERKRAETALHEQEDFFRLVAENSGDFIAVLDLDGKRLYNSPSYSHFFGDTRYLTGTDSFAEIHPDDQEHVRKVFFQAVKSGVGQHTEFRFVLPDGAVRQMESRSGIIRDEDGNPFRVVVVSNDITQRKQAEAQIYSLAFYDFLTKLPNRRMFSDRLRQAMAATRRSDRYGALMFLDLDNFKPINDAHGHGVGDMLLQEAARRIAACVREVDTVARFGGDEFVVLLTELDPLRDQSMAQAYMVADKIRLRLAEPYEITVLRDNGRETRVTAQSSSSIGLVLFRSFGDSEEDLLKYSDIAMYQAKDAGRNQVHFYDPGVSPASALKPAH